MHEVFSKCSILPPALPLQANIAVKDLFVEPKEKKTEGGAPGDGRKEARAGKKRKRKNAPGDDKGSDGEESEEDLRLDRKRERKEVSQRILL